MGADNWTHTHPRTPAPASAPPIGKSVGNLLFTKEKNVKNLLLKSPVLFYTLTHSLWLSDLSPLPHNAY